MSVKKKSIVVSFVALLSVIAAAIGMVPAQVAQAATAKTAATAATAATATTATPHAATAANGPYTVKGNKILDANNTPYIIHGVGRDGLEYDCNGDGYLDQAHLAFMGPGTNSSSGVYWYANTVRLPLSEGFWLHGSTSNCTASGYQGLVAKVVGYLNALHLNVMLDLQWTDAGGHSGAGGGPWALADSDSVTFWTQVATAYKGNPNVMFEVFNEPHPASWACWKNGCPVTSDTSYSNDCGCTKTVSYTGVGMQALVTAIRGTGANNLAIVGGMNWAYDLSGVPTNTITGTNVVYDTHPYNYSDKQPASWAAAFGTISQTYPVVSAESGQYDCGVSFMSQLIAYLENMNIGWVAWAWALQGQPCTYPQLILDYNGTPAQNMGYLIYQQLRKDAGVATQPTPPVSKTWYFAEGRVGQGFNEYLTLGNPDPLNNCQVQLNYMREGIAGVVTKTVTVIHSSRLTESVNGDLGIPSPSSSTAYSVSTVVSVVGGCNGIVAERPLYFNYHGINSGNDVMGSTSLGTNFYFGDVPTGSGYTSFLTILNPQSSAANVTATYYAGGKQVGQQHLSVPGNARGTIFPSGIALPTHVAAVVTSSQPVLVERPDYFSNINAGSAGTISGGAAVVGVQNLASDWLFAEGFTGNGNQPYWQEYLVIANVDPANTTASVTVKLELTNGSTKVSTISVGPMSQYIFNVNQATPQSSVSADVSSSGAKIVVEREQFFQYTHTVSGFPNSNVASRGGNDVIGQPGPATQTIYTFAEGYAAPNFNEWLTLQNPTNSNELIYITLVNQLGHVYAAPAVLVVAHSRSTVDITQLVLQNMFSSTNNATAAVSMTVQSYAAGAVFVAERPEYWNHSGTQGGDDVIGF